MSLACIVIGYATLFATLGPIALLPIALHLAAMSGCAGLLRKRQ